MEWHDFLVKMQNKVARSELPRAGSARCKMIDKRSAIYRLGDTIFKVIVNIPSEIDDCIKNVERAKSFLQTINYTFSWSGSFRAPDYSVEGYPLITYKFLIVQSEFKPTMMDLLQCSKVTYKEAICFFSEIAIMSIKNNMVYNDMKSTNVTVHDGRYKLIDFDDALYPYDGRAGVLATHSCVLMELYEKKFDTKEESDSFLNELRNDFENALLIYASLCCDMFNERDKPEKVSPKDVCFYLKRWSRDRRFVGSKKTRNENIIGVLERVRDIFCYMDEKSVGIKVADENM